MHTPAPETAEVNNKLVQQCPHLHVKLSPETVELNIRLVQQRACLHENRALKQLGKSNKLVKQCAYLHEKQSPETVEKNNKLIQQCPRLPRKQSPETDEMTIKLVQQCTCLHKKQSPETYERERQASTAMHRLAQSVSMLVCLEAQFYQDLSTLATKSYSTCVPAKSTSLPNKPNSMLDCLQRGTAGDRDPRRWKNYTQHYTVTTGSDESHFNVSIIVNGSRKTVSTSRNL